MPLPDEFKEPKQLSVFREGAPDGIYEDTPESKYRAHPAVAHSTLKSWVDGGKGPRGRFLMVGSLLHAVVLEPHKVAAQYATAPEDWDLRTTHGKNSIDDFERTTGKVAVRPREKQLVTNMFNALREDERSVEAFWNSDGPVEVACLYTYPETKMQGKCLIDKAIPGHSLRDIKTTNYQTEDDWLDALYRYNYDSQGASYSDAWEQLTGERLPFVFTCVSKQPPHDVWHHVLQPHEYVSGSRWVKQISGIYYRECYAYEETARRTAKESDRGASLDPVENTGDEKIG